MTLTAEWMFITKCRVCGSRLNPVITDLPFKVSETTIVILKEVPVLQCDSCSEYLLEDAVMSRVEEILQKVDAAAELEVIHYAASRPSLSELDIRQGSQEHGRARRNSKGRVNSKA